MGSMNSKHKVLAALGAVAFLSGAVGPYLDTSTPLSSGYLQLATAVAIGTVLATIALIVAWYHIDTNERHYKRSLWLNGGMIGLSIICFPYYLFRSRGIRGGFIALGLVLVALIGLSILSFAGESATNYALARSSASMSEPEPALVGTVESIVDGDTLEVLVDGGSIRVGLHGIDAPESGQPFFSEATLALRSMVEGKTVQVQRIAGTNRDRMLARVYQGSKDVNGELIKQGMAYAERLTLGQIEDGWTYCEFEFAARSEKRGIWALPWDDRIAPWEWRRRNELDEFADYSDETVDDCTAEINPQGSSVSAEN